MATYLFSYTAYYIQRISLLFRHFDDLTTVSSLYPYKLSSEIISKAYSFILVWEISKTNNREINKGGNNLNIELNIKQIKDFLKDEGVNLSEIDRRFQLSRKLNMYNILFFLLHCICFASKKQQN